MVLIFGPVLIVLLAAVDFAVGPRISLAVFHLLPVAAITWFGGRIPGLVAAAVCGSLWFLDTLPAIPRDLPVEVVGWMAAERLTFFILTMYLTAVLRRHAEYQRALATTDEMTGAANRRAFIEQASREISRTRRSGEPITLAFLDLDNFKRLNDSAGHAEGDRVLRAVARTMMDNIRVSDTLARVGGDEFVLLLPSTDAAPARAVIEKLRAALAATVAGRGWDITFSIGVATFANPPRTHEELIRAADRLQYLVKHHGKNSVMYETLGGEPPVRPALAA